MTILTGAVPPTADVPLGIGCFSGLQPPSDAEDLSNNDVPDCLVHCHGLGKPVAGESLVMFLPTLYHISGI